ncbi:hypothetical protein F53441_13417 [Fusarium austroafricanum]|uniref:Transcription factor domain-containing protein n=1 Tax=Fusarium austroafricanum TaxID=2364996 RepID=A0A8H4NI23_9HYPO|nr:hypothetical protein F53441_13417 [Fusarium austroafricanum]
MRRNKNSNDNNGLTILFLPVATKEPNSRREIELRLSSARSHIAKSMHRHRKASNLLPEEDDIDTNTQAKSTAISKITPERGPGHLLLTPAQLRTCVIPDKTLDSHSTMLLHYCTQFFWPGFELGSAAFHFPPFAVDYNTLVAQGPALVHAVLWRAAVSQAIRRKSRVTDRGSLVHYSQAMTYISKEITKPISEIHEQTLYAILSLCGAEMLPDEAEDISKKALDPPLAELSWIHVFGRRLHIDAHVNALVRLVDLKGGMHSLTNPSFQASFNYMDLTRATQKLVKPHFPVSQVYGHVKESHDRAKFFGFGSDFAYPACYADSSPQIDKLSELGLVDNIREVICDIRIWVKVIEAYHHGLLTNPDSSLLAAHRNLIQQRLLATLPEGYDGTKPLSTENIDQAAENENVWINEITQTALLIFSLGVTCPITYAPSYHHSTRRLQAQIERYMQSAIEMELFDFLTWLGMFGALCAEQVGDGRREWYIQFLSTIERKHIITRTTRTWEQVKQESLEPFLWSEVACDAAAEKTWFHAQLQSWDVTAWSSMLGTICG